MEYIPCPFCKKEGHKTVIKENGYHGRLCNHCNIIYISPRPTERETIDRYSHNKASLSAHTHIAGDFTKRLHARHTIAIIKRYIKKGTLLEIGSGAGYFLDEARSAGFLVHGLEPNPIQAQYIQSNLGIPCATSALTPKLFTNTSFDVIYHCDVISHFSNPIEVFTSVFDMLADNGFMVFETGNIADINEKYYDLFSQFQYPDHLFFWGQSSITKLCTLTGFELIASHHYNILPQLLLHKCVRTLKATLNKSLKKRNRIHDSVSHHKASEPWRGKKLYHYLNHIIRYKIGFLLPKNRSPQTIIFIVRKKMNRSMKSYTTKVKDNKQ